MTTNSCVVIPLVNFSLPNNQDDAVDYDYNKMFPLSPISDSLWSTSSSEEEIDSFTSSYTNYSNFNKQQHPRDYDHDHELEIPFKKQYKSTSDIGSQTDAIVEEEEEEEEDEVISISVGGVVGKLDNLSKYYGSYGGVDCICFSGLYKAGILISRKIKQSDYLTYITCKSRASELLCRIFQKNFRSRSDASFFSRHIEYLRTACFDVGQRGARQQCIEIINSFISLHIDS